ncbi:Rdx family-domain-containing protein [Cytidiella melzeri]|nr:Rdx family-domain-containing protein [Cytidiella melzeri]
MSTQEICVDCDPQHGDEAQVPTNSLGLHTVAPQNPLDPSTFLPPLPLPTPAITIEFCDRCRWQHRASWVSTELMLTFPSPVIKAVSLLPLNSEETGGRFRVWLFLSAQESPTLIWDRKVEGGFPELKVLKQRIRDRVQPGISLGHSDKK